MADEWIKVPEAALETERQSTWAVLRGAAPLLGG